MFLSSELDGRFEKAECIEKFFYLTFHWKACSEVLFKAREDLGLFGKEDKKKEAKLADDNMI